ncbi:CPBP family intramembrane glutamic endopeptidase [Metabacillus fastidiosus]|uniref:CPBP family intramembrane glutamic endopeptidase n=2 Tax=Metabacillus fastidiosus TaxID=1458 RepID=UPI002E1A3FAB|nr:CPBP family intramembrane metalloprotease [Metabacillus fastidiosus]
MVKQKKWTMIICMTLFAFISCLIALPYTTAVLVPPPGVEITKTQLLITLIINITVQSFIAIIIGVYLGPKVGLKANIIRNWIYKDTNEKFNGRSVLYAILAGVAGTAILILIDYYVFMPQLEELAKYSAERKDISFLTGLSTIFQGGYAEEVMLRFGAMTFVVWLLSLIFKKNYAWIYWFAIIGTAILFGIGHLGAVFSIIETVTPLLIVRTIFLNAVLGIICGYLYWKKGLEYAIIAHIVGDIIVHGFFE